MHPNCFRTVVRSAAVRVPRGLCTTYNAEGSCRSYGWVSLEIGHRLWWYITNTSTSNGSTQVLQKSAVFTVLASSCCNITTTVVLATNNRGFSIRSVMTHLACTIITLAETSFDFTLLNGCWFTERVRNYATTVKNWESIDHETEERNGVIGIICRLSCVCVFVYVPLLRLYSLKPNPVVHVTTKIKKGKQNKSHQTLR